MKTLLIGIGIGAIVALFFIKFFNKKGEIEMLDMYIGLVVAGRRTCNEENKQVTLVPKKWRDLVLADLEALGLDADGNQEAAE